MFASQRNVKQVSLRGLGPDYRDERVRHSASVGRLGWASVRECHQKDPLTSPAEEPLQQASALRL